MHTIKITTTQNIELEYDLASVGERIASYIIDVIIIGAYLIAVFMFIMNYALLNQNDWMVFIFFIPVFFYDLASEVYMNGQSVGKRVMNIKVVSLDGGQPTLGQYILRWLFRIVDFSMISQLCAVICVAATERKQRIGDMVAGTTVVRTVPRTGLQQTLYVPTPQADYVVTFPEVANLADTDMQLIKEVILKSNTGNTTLARHAMEKIEQTLNIRSDMEPGQFLQVLLADYNYITSRA